MHEVMEVKDELTKDIIIVSLHHPLFPATVKDRTIQHRNTFDIPVYHALLALWVGHRLSVKPSARSFTSERSVDKTVSWSEKLYPDHWREQVMFVLLEVRREGLLADGT
jgi:hypothetical protein